MSVIIPDPDCLQGDIDSGGGSVNLTAIDPLHIDKVHGTIYEHPASSTQQGYVTIGNQSFSGLKTFNERPQCAEIVSLDSEMPSKLYVDNAVLAMSGKTLSWQNEIIEFWNFTAIPPLVNGARYISTITVGSFDINNVYEWSTALVQWVETIPTEGYACYVTSDLSPLFANQCITFNGTAWVSLGSTITYSSLIGKPNQDLNTTNNVAFNTMKINSTVSSASTSDGVLQVAGGMVIEKNTRMIGTLTCYDPLQVSLIGPFPGTDLINVAGGTDLNINSTTDTVDATTGALQVMGGLSISKQLRTYGDVNMGNASSVIRINSTVDASNTITSALIIEGGVNIRKSLKVNSVVDCSTLRANILSTYIGGNTITVASGTMLSSNNITDTSDTATGAMRTAGGMYIAKQLRVGTDVTLLGTSSVLTVLSTVDASDTASGAIHCDGGVVIAKAARIGADLTVSGVFRCPTFASSGNLITVSNSCLFTIANTVDSSDTATGALKVAGGVYLAKQLRVGGNSTLLGSLYLPSTTGQLNISSTIDSSDTLTGALYVSGGAYIAKNLRVGGSIISGSVSYSTLAISGGNSATSTNSGALTVVGGVGIGGDLYCAHLKSNGLAVSTDSTKCYLQPEIRPGSGWHDLIVCETDQIGDPRLSIGYDGIKIFGTVDATGVTSGSLVTNGGISCTKNIYCGYAITAYDNITSNGYGLYYKVFDTTGLLPVNPDNPNIFAGRCLGTNIKRDLMAYSSITMFGISSNMSMMFYGFLNISVAATYTFYLSCDDYANLFLNGQKILSVFYTQGEVTSAMINLAVGYYPLYIEYWAYGATNTLYVSWSSTNFTKKYLRGDDCLYDISNSPQTAIAESTGYGNLRMLQDCSVIMPHDWGLVDNKIYISLQSLNIGTGAYSLNVFQGVGYVINNNVQTRVNLQTQAWNSPTSIQIGQLHWIVCDYTGAVSLLTSLSIDYNILRTYLILGRVWREVSGTLAVSDLHIKLLGDTEGSIMAAMYRPSYNLKYNACAISYAANNAQFRVTSGCLGRWPAVASHLMISHLFSAAAVDPITTMWLSLRNVATFGIMTNGDATAYLNIQIAMRYYDSGAATPVLSGSNQYVNHRICRFAGSDRMVFIPGQVLYGSVLANAIAGINTENPAYPAWLSDLGQACPISYVTCNSNDANWSTATFTPWFDWK